MCAFLYWYSVILVKCLPNFFACVCRLPVCLFMVISELLISTVESRLFWIQFKPVKAGGAWPLKVYPFLCNSVLRIITGGAFCIVYVIHTWVLIDLKSGLFHCFTADFSGSCLVLTNTLVAYNTDVLLCDFLFVHLHSCGQMEKQKESEEENCYEHEIWCDKPGYLTVVSFSCGLAQGIQVWALLPHGLCLGECSDSRVSERSLTGSQAFSFRTLASWLPVLGIVWITSPAPPHSCKYWPPLGQVCSAVSCVPTRGSRGVSLQFLPYLCCLPPPALGLRSLLPTSLPFFFPFPSFSSSLCVRLEIAL